MEIEKFDALKGTKATLNVSSTGGAHTVRGTMTPVGYAQISVTTAVSLSSIPVGARVAILQPETNALRWRDDGTAPTTSVGMPLAAGGTLTYDGDLTKIQLIAQTGTSTVNVAYYS